MATKRGGGDVSLGGEGGMSARGGGGGDFPPPPLCINHCLVTRQNTNHRNNGPYSEVLIRAHQYLNIYLNGVGGQFL